MTGRRRYALTVGTMLILILILCGSLLGQVIDAAGESGNEVPLPPPGTEKNVVGPEKPPKQPTAFDESGNEVPLPPPDTEKNVVNPEKKPKQPTTLDVSGDEESALSVMEKDSAANAYSLWWDDPPDCPDDQYEENDSRDNATLISATNWITAIQCNDDWYQIDVAPNFERVLIDCRFTDADGDIDIKLFDDASEIELAQSYSTTDNEYIDYVGPSGGTYFILVYYGDEGNTYNLWWGDIAPGEGCCIDIRGNANGDQSDDINISDITFLVDYLFGVPLGPVPPCLEEGNANGDVDNFVNISDITYLVEYLFGVPLGPAPPACP